MSQATKVLKLMTRMPLEEVINFQNNFHVDDTRWSQRPVARLLSFHQRGITFYQPPYTIQLQFNSQQRHATKMERDHAQINIFANQFT